MINIKKDIAIIGIAFNFPGDISQPADLWQALMDGQDLVTEVPQDRFGTQFYQHDRREELGRSVTFKAGVVNTITDFDPAFFGISPREALKMDPQQRLLLELTWHALEDAGVLPKDIAQTQCGVFVGISALDYGTRTLDDLAGMNAYSMLGSTLSIAANRISFIYDLHGPSLSIDTACSSSLVALHTACESLKRGESSMALVGGVNVLAHPYPFIGFSQASMLSKDGRSKSFAADGNGYVRAEGGAVLLLKPLKEAKQDGDRIHAVIRATGTNADGGQKTGITMPSAEGQARLLHQVLNQAGIDPAQIDYVEAHGTGTAVGDPIEIQAIGSVYGAARSEDNPLPVGSIKSNVGHMEPASGMAGLIKAVLTLKHRQIPPSIHSSVLNPHLNLNAQHIHIVRTPTALPNLTRPPCVAVNSFGFGGTNAHAIIQSATTQTSTQPADLSVASDSLPVLFLSAKETSVLPALATAYADLIAAQPTRYADIAANAALRRQWLPERLAVSGATVDEVVSRLHAYASTQVQGGSTRGVVQATVAETHPASRCAFVYGGNGAQWQGMGLALMQESPFFKQKIQALDRLMRPMVGFSIIKELKAPSDSSRMSDTAVAQPLLFALQVALTQLLRRDGITANAYTGHSVGEIAAAWAAGCLSLKEAAEVVAVRSRAQAKTAGSGRMLAAAISADDFTATLSALELDVTTCSIAGFNAPSSLTLVGEHQTLCALNAHWEQAGIFARLLDLDYAFHSAAMESIAEEIHTHLAHLNPKNSSAIYVSTVTGDKHLGEKLNAEYWWRNVREPVQFHQAMSTLIQDGYTLFVEISPHAILQRYITQCAEHEKVAVRALPIARQNADSLLDVSEAMLRIRLHQGPRDISPKKKIPFIDLPKYPWIRQRYWMEETSEGYNLIQRKRLHPLLGYALSEAPLSFENVLDTYVLPYLADHKVDGAVVLPGAAYAEMALAAAKHGLGWADIELRAFEIHHPMVFEAGQSRTIRTQIFGLDHRFKIQSRQRLTNDEWVTHAIGQVRPAGDLSLHRTISPPKASADVILNGATHYQNALNLGLNYGASFQGIRELTLHERTVRASLDLTDAVRNDTAHGLHPALLDLCFQSLLALVANEPNQAGATYLPVQIGRLILPAPTLKASHLQGEIKRFSPHSILADFSLLAADGQVICQMSDCRFRAAHFAQGRALPPLWQTLRLPLRPSTSILWTGDFLTKLNTHPAIETNPLRQRYHEEIRPLLDALVVSYAYQALSPLVDATGALPDSSPHAQGLYAWLMGVLEAQGYATGRRLSDAPPVAVDIWTLLNRDYPEANAEATLIARLGTKMHALLAGNAPLNDPINSLAHSALLAQWQSSGLTSEGAQLLIEQFCLNIAKHTVHTKQSQLRILYLGQDPLICLTQLSHYLNEESNGAFPALGLHIVASSPDKDAMAAWSCEHSTHLTALSWDEVQQKLAESILTGFDLVFLDEGTLGVSMPPLAQLERACSGGLLVVQRPAKALYLDFIRCTSKAFTSHDDEGNWPCENKHSISLNALSSAPTVELLEPADTLGLGASLSLSAIEARETKHAPKPTHAVCITALNSGAQAQADSLRQSALKASQPDAALWIHSAWKNHPSSDLNAATVKACQLFLSVLQHWITQESASPKYLVLPFGALDSVDDAQSCPVNTALWGMARVAMNEHPALNLYLIDARGDFNDAALFAQLAQVVSTDSCEHEIIITPQSLETLRLAPAHLEQGQTAKNPRYRLGFNVPGQLRHLHWQTATIQTLDVDAVELKVHAVGLNFRDVMFAMGLLGDEALESGFSGASLGLECAGVITRVGSNVQHVAPGDAVLGFGPQCFASHVITRGNAVGKMPSHWHFNEAATVPTVFFTVYYALVEMARLRAGERVLIHGGAGGVGIAAIQLAQHLGAEIYATAGSDEKRDFLRLMGVEHIYSSRDMHFAEQIMADTHGQGIDVVLNSLAGEAIERNLDVLRPFGRFLELGKRDFYANTPMGLRPFKDNISYFGIDADQLMSARPELTAHIFQAVMALFADGVLHPLPHQTFSADRVIDAFRSMQQARHIGKLVVSLNHAPQHIKALPKPAWQAKEDASYLVTGGLTGFGFETARWLLSRGAGHVILAARRGTQTPGLAEKIESLGALKSRVEVVALDVSDSKAVTSLCSKISKTKHPLRGIIHAAMVIDDALIQNLNAERMASVITPKVAGAWHLHQATQNQPLDFFVMYSSVTTLIGNAGQANYVAANAALEALASARRGQGLAATALCWGPISDVGYLTAHQAVLSGLESRTGGAAITSQQALNVLELSLQNNLNGLSAMGLNGNALQRILPAHSLTRFAFLHTGQDTGDTDNENLKEILQSLSPAEATQRLCEVIRDEVAQVLGLPSAKIDTQQSLYDMGLDSLMAVELALGIEKRTGVRLSAMALNEGPTVTRLAERLLDNIHGTTSLTETPSADAALLNQLAQQHADGLTRDEQAALQGLTTP
ncbi:MAG: type I polyketide synthase [Halothiobacillaceae bacterium]